MIEWDNYWAEKSKIHNKLYDKIAVQYRKYIIKPYLKKYIYQYFKPGSILLHAGCGSGQMEDSITNDFIIIGLDISQNALNIYKSNHLNSNLIYGTILSTGIQSNTVDGIYNLGVMEHSTTEEIHTIMLEFNRILKPDGRIILFVPPEYGSTVIFFKVIHYILNNIFNKNIHFQPAEINRIKSRKHAEFLIKDTGLYITKFNFEFSDMFTHIAIVLKKIS
jgi:2-polyprenyl-3-methyl-5-hydroxy-6-metoxy-1,4-benzoquinol methylase